MQPMANWLASALPVADAMSFEFDDINVTAQRVIMRTDVFYERTGEREVEYKRLMIVCRRSSASNDKTIMMATFSFFYS